MTLLTYDEIMRGFLIGSLMVFPALAVSWYLAHVVCAKHEQFQRDMIHRLQEILEECKEHE